MRMSRFMLPALAGLSLGMAGHTIDYTTLDGGAEPLRGRFNADSGKVRVVMLVAPT